MLLDVPSPWENLDNNQPMELDADKIEDEIKADDEDFSNTVSMEITKIMDEISNVAEQPVEPEISIPVVEE